MIVLLRWTVRPDASPDDVVVHAVVKDRAELIARLQRIERSNRPYMLRQLGQDLWEIGPTEDEGFFGHKPIRLKAVVK